jgi:DNA mismatch endonuclease (patch repair protein)
MAIRRMLFALGYRYRLHVKALAGCPDLVFRSRKKVIFVHGCFWHGHSCPRGHRPSSNREFWDDKLGKNQQRDRRNVEKLVDAGWRILTIWECETHDTEALKARLTTFLNQIEEV